MRELVPTNSRRSIEAWVLFDTNVKYMAVEVLEAADLNIAVAQLEMPEVPPEERAGKYLMRVLVTPDELVHASANGQFPVHMPSVRSHPHETVWSETQHAQETRVLIAEHPVAWPK